MPLVEPQKEPQFNLYTPLDTSKPIVPEFGEAMGAAFRLENDVVAGVELMSRPEFAAEPGFDLITALKERNQWERRDRFRGTLSTEELEYRIAKAEKEDQDRQTLANAGWPGLFMAMFAGVLSPTMFLPLTTAARGAKAFTSGARLGLVSVGAQELVLQASQETRTPEESAIAIGAGTVLGALLGGAKNLLPVGELDRIANDMYAAPGAETISTYGSSAGAATAAATSAGGLKQLPWGTQWLTQIGPVTRALQQNESPIAQWMTAQFGTAGLRLEGNARGIASAAEGTIENSIKLWDANLYRAVVGFDEAWAEYMGTANKVFSNVRADAAGLITSGKMSRREFAQAVGRAMFSGDASDIPQVEKAAQLVRKEIYDPLLKEAQEVGILTDLGDIADASYLNRLYDDDVIQARFGDFVDVMEEHISAKLTQEFQESLEKQIAREGRDSIRADDLERAPEEVEKLREEFEAKLKALEEGKSDEIAEAEETIADLRSQARELRKDKTPRADLERKELLKQARDAEKDLGESFVKFKADRADIRRRLRNLNRNIFIVGRRYAAKLQKIERIEEQQLASLDKVIKAAQRVDRDLEKVSRDKLEDQVEKLQGRFYKLGKLFDDGEERLKELVGDPLEGDTNKLLDLEAVQEGRADRMTQLANRIEDIEALDDDALRSWIKDAVEESKSAVNALNSRRALRRQRLIEQAKKFDPRKLEAQAKDLRERGSAQRLSLSERFRTLGADDIDLDKGVADFSTHARGLAQEIAHKILGTNNRIQGLHLILDKRGPELARMLDIPSNFTSKAGVQFSDFMITDIERAMRAYERTLSADIEIARKFGTADAREWFQRLTEEYNAKVDALKEATNKKGEKLSKKEIEERTKKLSKEYTDLRVGLEALVDRSRHSRGIPKDPRGFATRAGRTMMNLNVLRFMGSVSVSSIPDLGRPVMKYGLTRAFRDGFVPFIARMKKMELSRREAKLAGIGNDPVLHTRAYQLYDMLDEYSHRSKFESGVEYATSRMGVLALFDYWTAAMKQISSGVALGKMSDSLALVIEGKGSAKEIAEATEFLAAAGIGEKQSREIWQEMLSEGGSDIIDGVRIPNTEAWKNPTAVRAFRAGLRGEADDTIITPGFEKPLWIDGSLGGRMLGQFKSFAMASTTKTMMAGLQQRDMAFVTGTMISLALGAFSYYLWAVSVGGKAYEEMLSADIDKWADEAITRSGILAVFGEAQRVAENIPALSDFATLSGKRTTRRAGTDITEALLGPSFDLVEKTNAVLVGLDDPTQSTLHSLRLLLPLQNIFFLRKAFDAVEASVGADLPERRGQ